MAKVKGRKGFEAEPENVDVRKRIQEYWQALEEGKEDMKDGSERSS